MRFEVTIKYTDEFDTDFNITVSSDNVDKELVAEGYTTCIEEIVRHCKNAIRGLDFNENTIEDWFK